MARIPGAGAWPPRPVRSLLKPLGVSGAGMGAMSRALDIISQNIANAETTRTPDGGPYQRQVVVFQRDAAGGVQAAGVVQDTRPGSEDYDPGHPDADANGFVKRTNVDVNTEIVDLMIARRVHEANATVFQAAKAMLKRAIDI
ncbi:MAG: flagellar basal body rod protein FlgC [Gemmatimonadetes bacterium]|jgi:flagellar basal-body rod protein FlgC|nr:flagellar basal body rod protein FlgC [Gemmatimonadota bacterium]MBP6669692.1 flagellar basal body rod protein FlgC [Gemmatimonadales bacterium]MBK6778277.1 flagellar basal body rod protein FlgC [Gemmatimonadota bacterium]MBK7349413.1 flagellar basal body rod protein FlgC [Gemmatimonadota bacterium]MBK7716424.1 flagellar basal body rod protein FlgC [Gemmatimonadota bacterium]